MIIIIHGRGGPPESITAMICGRRVFIIIFFSYRITISLGRRTLHARYNNMQMSVEYTYILTSVPCNRCAVSVVSAVVRCRATTPFHCSRDRNLLLLLLLRYVFFIGAEYNILRERYIHVYIYYICCDGGGITTFPRELFFTVPFFTSGTCRCLFHDVFKMFLTHARALTGEEMKRTKKNKIKINK